MIDIVVQDAQTGDPITNFKWLINLDNSHDNPSVTAPASYSPVVASGDQSNASGIVLPDTVAPNRGYLVSVLANDGVGTLNDPDYKLGGAHFTLPADAGDVVVRLQPNPLPLATVRVRVFHDNHLVNGEDDIPLEAGLAGFRVTLSDRVGEVTTDWFGNPICTQYETNPDGSLIFDPDGSPIPIPGTGGICVTDATGYATIPYLGPNKYEVQAIPPDGSGWIQTTTIEGTLANDAWVEEGHSGYSTEEGFTQAVVWFGFVRQCTFGSASDDCPTNNTAGTGSISGTVRSIALDDESGVILLGNPVVSPYVALNNIGGNDEQVYTARGNANGTFTIPNVPPGLYQLVIWDAPLDHIIQFVTVQVGAGQVVNLGDIGIPRWFGQIRGSVFIDSNENGIRDPGEGGLANQDLDTRFKDGTIQYTTFSDSSGNYVFPEVFELEHFAIAEVGYGRLKHTGAASYEADEFGNPINYPNGPINQDLGLAGLLQAEITWGGTTNYIDWGKKAHAPGQNGGIAGIVFNATTRNELDARLQAAEDYEPGVPGVTVNLYAPVLDANGDPVYDPVTGAVMRDHLANVYVTDSWYDSLPTNCIPRGSVGRTAGQVQPPNIFVDCIELPALLPQIRPGVFDGGYAFEEDCSNLAATDPFDPDQLLTSCAPLAAGLWVVEVVPLDGYRVVREEDINVFGGDQFVPEIPPPPCAGPLHVVDVAGVAPDGPNAVYNPDFAVTPSPLAPNGGSPYEGQQRPLCTQRLVDLPSGASANADFFIFTDVQVPGRIRGVLLDDLTLELDPASPMYAEKRGIPNAPVGIRDFTGRLITTVYSDDNGYWEVLLPSTGVINCPTPGGVCPGVYQVIGNDPGTPDSPNAGWNPNYGTLKLSFEVFPGTTTYADVAILPITGFVQGPNSQFETAPVCDIAATTPDIRAVSQPYGNAGGSFTITGSGFGGSQGSGAVTLDGAPLTVNSWNTTTINVTIPGATAPGPHQLLVRNSGGAVSPTGITLHVIGGGYNPPQRHVGPGQTYATIQAALDAAADGDLVLVHPGVYYETLLVDERLKLQGYGPGASVIDGRFFNFGGISAEAFASKIAGTAYDGPAEVPIGQVITVLAENGEFVPAFNAQIDGFAIRGGMRVRGNRVLPSQGGGIYAHAYARNLAVSNNLIQSNAGNLGGAVILGQPYATNPDAGNARNNENDSVRIQHNRVLNNGGVSLAGALALFNGAEGYEIDHNVICGNYSAEYGGGISNYGYTSGSIHDNQILYNYAFDEGGGVMIAGEQPVGNPLGLSPGTGDISIERNLIQGNLSNDDGGGIRLLQPVDGKIRIANNMVVNNLATDTGGGIALDDALRVEIINNTVARNISTATAEDADRSTCNPPLNGTCPHGAGLVSERHSNALIAAKAPPTDFSNPVLFNNIFWQNEAFFLDGTTGLLGDAAPAGFIDLEVIGSTGVFSARYSVCTAFSAHCPGSGANNISADPLLVQAIDLDFDVLGFANDPAFITVIVRSTPGDPQGNYHLTIPGSPAVNAGVALVSGVCAPTDDFDGDGRPNGPAHDIGADEQAGAAPGVCTPGGGPVVPATPVLDTFNRANGSVGTNWRGNTVSDYYRIDGQQAQVRRSGYLYWNAATFGANQEAYFTFAKVVPSAAEQDLLLKVNNLSATGGALGSTTRLIKVQYNAPASSVTVWTYCGSSVTGCAGQGWVVRATFSGVTFANGDQFIARARSTGFVEVYRNTTLIGSINVTLPTGSTPGWPTTYATTGGRIGVWFIRSPDFAVPNDARFDNFGGGTLP
ncbi:MAG TPA: IPT/TIG domain-containing protein [Roseiflexaceae bacterium]|nr:IPT/TIG domain-containing protein [Roseiflexaceae bacterium]